MRHQNKSILDQILLALMPFSKEGSDFIYHPEKFINQLELEKNKESNLNARTAAVAICRAKQKGYLREVETKNKEKTIRITPKGKMKIYKYLNETAMQWDGKWRILFFDIPEKHRSKRDSLRKKLKELGFKQYQISAWICPFDFTEELDVIIYELQIDKNVQYVIGDSVKGEDKLKSMFNMN